MNNLNDALHKTAWRGQNNLNLPKTKRWNYSQERDGGVQGVRGDIVMNSNFE